VELIEGEIIDMPPIGIDHAYGVTRLTAVFTRKAGTNAIVYSQNPIYLNPHSEPQPDIALLRYRDDFYRHTRPGPEDVLLLIEVADSSLRYDREVKLSLYARHAIPEVWIVDLEHQRLEVYRRPVEDRYLEMLLPKEGEIITPEGLPGCGLELGDLF
ncbi:MAG: Uma2 family endonuclease, partial [Methylococcales bacterium]